MKIQVITSRYPSEKEPYNHMFVHVRNIEYLKHGHNVEVYVPSEIKNNYYIDGIKVHTLPVSEIVKKIDLESLVMVHLLYHSLIKKLDGGIIYDFLITHDKPTLFFIHGIETQKIWKSRREDIELAKPKSIARFIYRDFYLIKKMKKVFQDIINNTTKIHFITVSKWMQHDVEETLGMSIDTKVTIIPNGIDTKLFTFTEHWENRHKLLTVRPLSFKGKYAIDLAIDTMKYLSHTQITLDIYGKGADVNKIIEYIRNSNLSDKIVVHDTFIEHSQIPNIHKNYGVYYAVTRMDAQGVSMCEAMASGMPTVSFDTCAIPEFIQDKETGVLVTSYDVKEAAMQIDELVSNKNLFTKLSESGRKSMEAIDISITTEKELKIGNGLLS